MSRDPSQFRRDLVNSGGSGTRTDWGIVIVTGDNGSAVGLRWTEGVLAWVDVEEGFRFPTLCIG